MSKRKSWIKNTAVNQEDLSTIRSKLFQVSTEKFWKETSRILPNGKSLAENVCLNYCPSIESVSKKGFPHVNKFVNAVANTKSCNKMWILHELLGQVSIALRKYSIQTNEVGNYTCKSKRVTVIAAE